MEINISNIINRISNFHARQFINNSYLREKYISNHHLREYIKPSRPTLYRDVIKFKGVIIKKK